MDREQQRPADSASVGDASGVPTTREATGAPDVLIPEADDLLEAGSLAADEMEVDPQTVENHGDGER